MKNGLSARLNEIRGSRHQHKTKPHRGGPVGLLLGIVDVINVGVIVPSSS